MNRILDTYLQDLRPRMAAMPLREREAVLEEIEHHLRDAAETLQKLDPKLSEDEAYLKATEQFGEPDEIGVAYGPQGGVVRQTTGERLLDVALLTGRGIGRGVGTVAIGAGSVVKGFLKWVGIMTVALLGAIVILGAVGLLVAPEILGIFQDDIAALRDEATTESDAGRTLYDHRTEFDYRSDRSWNESFQLPADTAYARITVHAHPTTTGCGTITITAPDGSAAYDSGPVCYTSEAHTTFSITEPGTYRVHYEAQDMVGHMEMRVIGYPSTDNTTASG